MFSTASSSSTTQKPTCEDVRQAAKTLAYHLKSQPYGIVGGGALVLLGSERQTEDVDFVVPKGDTPKTRAILKKQTKYFTVESRTNHTIYNSKPPVKIEILTPPTLFRSPFDASTPTIQIDGVKVLKPTLILNAKCLSILGRATVAKKASDASDIQYLLWWCTTADGKAHGCVPTATEIPNASKEFYEWFIGVYEQKELWSNGGYNAEIGRFP